MKVWKNEFHSVKKTVECDIPDEVIIERFGSLERFRDVVLHGSSEWDEEPEGEAPTDEESQALSETIEEFAGEAMDNWLSETSGDYETIYVIGEENQHFK